MQLAAGNIDAFERPAHRVHRRLEGVESPDGLGALAPRLAQRPLRLAPPCLVARAYLAQPPQRLDLALNRRVGATLQLAPHLVHLVEHMKAVVALLGIGEHLTDPRRYPLRRILDHHRQPKPLTPTLAKQLRPRRAVALSTQRQPEPIPRVEVHPRQHRLALAEHLIKRPRLDAHERRLRVEPPRPCLGLDQHRSPGVIGRARRRGLGSGSGSTTPWLTAKLGEATSSADCVRATQAMHRLGGQMAAFHRGHDVLLTPGLATGTAVKLGWLDMMMDDVEEYWRRVFHFSPFTVWFNLTGQAATPLLLEQRSRWGGHRQAPRGMRS